MTAALRSLLREVFGCEELARVLLRRPDIDDLRSVPRHDLLEDVVAERADRGVWCAGAVLALRVGRRVVRQRTLLRDPLRAAAVDELHVLVPVVLQQPEEPRGEPVVVVTVRDDCRTRRDALLRKKRLELLLVEKIADRMLLKVGLPVQADRRVDVALLVCGRVDVYLEDAD